MLWIGVIIIVVCLAIDLLSKYLVLFSGNFVNTVEIIPHVLEFKLYKNTGAAYGILEDQMWFFYIVTIIAVVGLGFLFSKGNFKNKKIYTIGVSLLIAGALGNAVNRVVDQYVIDFVHFPFLAGIHQIFNFYCNFADACLTVGIIFVVIEFLFLDSRRKKKHELALAASADEEKKLKNEKNDQNQQ